MPPPAVQEYQVRLQARCDTRETLTAADARFAFARLATFSAGVVLAVRALYAVVSPWLLPAPLAVFLWLARGHAQTLSAREVAIRGIGFYERGMARLEDRWVGTGEPGERFRDDHHVYANDLDLFGRGSLFELLSLARTRTGEARLAGWLTAPADPSEIQARQAAVEELAPSLDLREQLAVSGTDVRVSVHTDRLLEWAESPMPARQALRAVIWFFTVGTVLAIVYLAFASVWWPLVAVIVVHTVALRAFRDEINGILSANAPGTHAAARSA